MRNIYYETMMGKLAGSTPFADADAKVYEPWRKAKDDLQGAAIEIDKVFETIKKNAKPYNEAVKRGDDREAGIIGAVITAALVTLSTIMARRTVNTVLKNPEIQKAIAREEAFLRSKKYSDLPTFLNKLAKFRVSVKDKIREIGEKIKQGFSNAKAKVKGFFGMDSAFVDRIVHDSMNYRLALYRQAGNLRRKYDSRGRIRYVVDDEFGFESIGPMAESASNSVKSGKNWLKASAAMLILSGILGTLAILAKKQPDVFKRIYDFVRQQIADIKAGKFKGKISAIKNKVLSMINAAKGRIAEYRLERELDDLLGKTQKLRDSNVRKVSKKLNRMIQRKIDNEILRTLDSCRSLSRCNDVMATSALIVGVIKYFVIPWLMKCATSAVIGSMTASLKQKVFDPLVNKVLARFKSYIQNKNKDETYTKAFWNGVSGDFMKIIEMLKKEGSFIAGKLKQGFDKLKVIFSRRGDSRRRILAAY